jgi:hypothetical protein
MTNKEQKIKLTSEQEKALQLMMSGRNVFLTGKAGTGKSTVLDKFQEKRKCGCVFLAPTGIAAINIGGSTIHSFFQLKPTLQTPESMENIGSKRCDLIRSVRTIVIDEISMVRSDLFVAIDIRLKEITGCNKPFGGKQVILVGDFLQLPPVVKEKTEADYLDRELGGHYAFQTALWQQADLQCVCLQTVHRQGNDALFMTILNHLRYGELEIRDIQLEGLKKSLNVIEVLTRLCFVSTPLEHPPIYLCTTNRNAEALNQFFQGKLEGEVHVFRAMIRGRFPEGDQPTPEMLALKIGARVMTLTNKRTSDGEIEYVNGEIGVIEDIEDGENAVVHVRLDRGPIVSVQRTKWSKYEYDLELDANTGKPIVRQHEVGSFVQIPLKLAYGVTIHKSQGLTLDFVEVKLGNGCFASGQLYTALSRCRNIKNLRIDRPIAPADAVLDQAVIAFYRKIESGHQLKGKCKAVELSISAENEGPDKAIHSQRHGKKDAARGCVMDQEDADMPKTGTTSRSSEADSEQASEGRKTTSNPDIDHLLIVYRNQNEDEKYNRMTRRLNGKGFNKMDAPILTELAEKYLDNGNLTKDELATVHHLIAKYRRQWG